MGDKRSLWAEHGRGSGVLGAAQPTIITGTAGAPVRKSRPFAAGALLLVRAAPVHQEAKTTNTEGVFPPGAGRGAKAPPRF